MLLLQGPNLTEESFMNKLLIAGTMLLAMASTAKAADHLFTATAAGGLTPSSQPFQNGVTNPGRFNDNVPGRGSPLSGADHTTPATDTTNSGQVKTPPSVSAGKTAPSGHSVH